MWERREVLVVAVGGGGSGHPSLSAYVISGGQGPGPGPAATGEPVLWQPVACVCCVLCSSAAMCAHPWSF